VPIKSVVEGDLVLTHTGEYKEVTAHYNQGLKPLFSVSSELTREISTTENHPFYVRSKAEDGLSSPQWKEARELITSDYLGFPINIESQLPQRYPSLDLKFQELNFWKLIGILLAFPFTLNCARAALTLSAAARTGRVYLNRNFINVSRVYRIFEGLFVTLTCHLRAAKDVQFPVESAWVNGF